MELDLFWTGISGPEKAKFFLPGPRVELNWGPVKFPFTRPQGGAGFFQDGPLYAKRNFKPGDPNAPTLPISTSAWIAW